MDTRRIEVKRILSQNVPTIRIHFEPTTRLHRNLPCVVVFNLKYNLTKRLR